MLFLDSSTGEEGYCLMSLQIAMEQLLVEGEHERRFESQSPPPVPRRASPTTGGVSTTMDSILANASPAVPRRGKLLPGAVAVAVPVVVPVSVGVRVLPVVSDGLAALLALDASVAVGLPCTQCGYAEDDASRFCTECGAQR